MTIPEDVRTAAYTLMQRHLTEPFANDEERRLVLRQADDACEILAAWLDAQPEAPTERWEPVEAGQGDAVLKLVEDGQLLGTWLLDDLRLCRRVKKA